MSKTKTGAGVLAVGLAAASAAEGQGFLPGGTSEAVRELAGLLGQVCTSLGALLTLFGIRDAIAKNGAGE